MTDERNDGPKAWRRNATDPLGQEAEPSTESEDQPEVQHLERSSDNSVTSTTNRESDEQMAKGKADAETTVERLYQEGKPFWTKELFRDVEAQLANIDTNHPFDLTWKGIDGRLCYYVSESCIDHNDTFHCRIGFKTKDLMTYQIRHATDWKEVRDSAFSSIIVEFQCWPSRPHSCWEPYFDQTIQTWLDSVECGKLRGILRKTSLDQVDKIICFGLGDCTSWDPDLHIDSRNSTQHAAVLTIRDMVKEKTGREVPILVQDPQYTYLTKRALRSYGFTIVEGAGAQGFVEVDDNTLVMSVFPSVPVKAIIADIARPPVFICGTLLTLEDYIGYDGMVRRLDPDTPRVVSMLRNEYTENKLAEHDGGSAFGGISVFIRRNINSNL